MRRCGFIDVTSAEIADKLDALAPGAKRAASCSNPGGAQPQPCRKGQTLLKLATGGFFTEGALAARARELILSYLAKPGFLAGYLAQPAQDGRRSADEKAMAS